MSLEAVVSSLAVSLEVGVPCFVLIDPMLGEPVRVDPTSARGEDPLSEVRQQAWGRPVHAIPLAPSVALHSSLHPYLVEMEGADDPWLAETIDMAWAETAQSRAGGLASPGKAPHRIGAWLQSSLPSYELVQAISSLMRVNTNALTAARYQRLGDRRVLAWLRRVVGDARVAAQLGRIRRWCYLDVCGNLAVLESPEEEATPLRLSPSEWLSFMQGELLHQTIARWLGAEADLLQRIPQAQRDEAECYAQALSALKQAEAAARRWPQRFVQQEDQVAWAALTLLHPGFGLSRDEMAVLSEPPRADEAPATLSTLSPKLSAMRLKATP